MNAAKRLEIFRRLRAQNPHPRGELEYRSPFELLIAVVLSAQATDRSVNQATAKLFPVASTPQALLALGEVGLIPYIKTIGLYRTKARNIITLCRQLLEEHGGVVPPRPRGTGQARGGRAEDRKRRAQRGVRPADDRRRHPYLPRRQPYRACARQDNRRGRAQADPIHACGIRSRRASLADSARALRLRRAEAEVRRMRDRRLLRVPRQDAARAPDVRAAPGSATAVNA